MSLAVRAEHLSIGYGREAIIEDIHLDLPWGQILALVGTNGSGKTTLLRTLAGLLPPLSGTLEIGAKTPTPRKGRIAYLGQFHPSSFMLPLRVVDVIRMARFGRLGLFRRASREDEDAVQHAMEAMGISGLATASLSGLSGGQRQRVFLAQALAQEADLILMDEPAANLDAPGRDTYRRLLRVCADEGRAVVVATHDIDEAAAYDQAMLLARRVVAQGLPGEVLKPETLMTTFGVVGRIKEGRMVIMEREHGCCCDDDNPDHGH